MTTYEIPALGPLQRIHVRAKGRRCGDLFRRARQPVATDFIGIAALTGIDHLRQQRHAGRPACRKRRRRGIAAKPCAHFRQSLGGEDVRGGGRSAFVIPIHDLKLDQSRGARIDLAQWIPIPPALAGRRNAKKGRPYERPFHCRNRGLDCTRPWPPRAVTSRPSLDQLH